MCPTHEALNPPASLRTFADAQAGFALGGCACAGNLEILRRGYTGDFRSRVPPISGGSNNIK